jgi:hypothetical protein
MVSSGYDVVTTGTGVALRTRMVTRGLGIVLLSHRSSITACAKVSAGLLAIACGCSTPSSQSGDTAGATAGSPGQPAGVGEGGESSGGGVADDGGRTGTAAGLGGLGDGGRTAGSGGTTSAGGRAASGGTAALGGAAEIGGAAAGSGGTTGLGGHAGTGGETLSGGAGTGVGGDIANAGSGSGGGSTSGGATGVGGDTGTGGMSTGGGDGGCVPAPGPCTETTYYPVSATSLTTNYFYDDSSRLVRTETDAEPPDIRRYSYDEAGNLVELKSDACSGDPAAGGSCVWFVYTYDEQGNLLLEQNNGNSPNLVTGCTEYTYDENGLLLTFSYYEWCTGDVAEYTAFEYELDAAGQVVTETDTDVQGNVTEIIHYTRNAAGQPLVVVHETTLTDDYQVTYTYDEQGNELTRRILSLEGETEGEERLCYVKTYDDCGNTLTMNFFQDCNVQVSRTTTWTYTCFGE